MLPLIHDDEESFVMKNEPACTTRTHSLRAQLPGCNSKHKIVQVL